MKAPVIAIGLDAAQPDVLDAWMDQGYLKNLARLRKQGAYGLLENFSAFSAETPWTTFATGCRPHKTGYWSPLRFRKGSYKLETRAAYEYEEFPPFYALGQDYRVAAFDVPQVRLNENISGVQVAAWGAHSPQIPSGSLPPELFGELVKTHGAHPGLHKDYSVCLDLKTTNRLRNTLKEGIARRSAICQEILQQEPWDLFVTVFGEAHSAGHNFWQLSQPDHPLYETFKSQVTVDPMLECFEAIDKAIGEILSKAPDNARVLVFSAHGMGPNTMDLPSTTILPEFLYRLNFPGQTQLFSRENSGAELEPPLAKMENNFWERHIWGTKHDTSWLRTFLRRRVPNKLYKLVEGLIDPEREGELISPFRLGRKTRIVPFQPAAWYAPLWPSMKAFALPSFAEGYVRVNLKGREPNGLVAPEDYDAFCDQLVEKIRQMKDARTGVPMAQEIIRTRQSPTEDDSRLPDADIVVVWQEEYASDSIESPDVGRIGPVPHYRSGSHRPEGFFVASGPGIEPSTTVSGRHALDISPTILALVGAPIPEYLQGEAIALLKTEASVG
ncbi:MAG: alkaline phosphatase family protein [Elainellaceae cyanobacterium]